MFIFMNTIVIHVHLITLIKHAQCQGKEYYSLTDTREVIMFAQSIWAAMDVDFSVQFDTRPYKHCWRFKRCYVG